jgi:uridine kinase
VNSPAAGILHLDAYYLDALPPELIKNGEANFDHPEAFDWTLLKHHLEVLKAGGTVAVPTYDYARSRRKRESEVLGPCRTILFEGIYSLFHPEVRKLLDLMVYLHVDADIRFIRRLHRDIRERSRTIDGIIRQYYDTVRPMHHEHLEHQRQYAHLVVGEETELAAGVIAARVAEAIR